MDISVGMDVHIRMLLLHILVYKSILVMRWPYI